MSARLRDLGPGDLGWVHALNQTHATELSSQTPAAFRALIARARYARAIEDEGAFLLAFDRRPAPFSPNFDWFQARFERFLYIDRIAVDARHRRKGLAQALYGDLAAFARDAGFQMLAAEVNSDPPNPASDALHAALGFTVVGEAYLADRDKTVRYFRLPILT